MPKQVDLPNRTFYAKYKRVRQERLPPNIRLRRTYRGNPTRGRQPRTKPEQNQQLQ